MPIPSYQSLLLPVLRLAADEEKRVSDVEPLLADQLGLTDVERAERLPSGRQRLLHNRIHWAKFYLMKAGLLRFPQRGRFEDRLGLDRIYVQAKRYNCDAVGRPELQKFVGSMVGEGGNKGVFVTTSSFHKNALDYVKTVPQRIILIDGERLADLMMEYNVGVKIERIVEFKRIDEDFYSAQD